MQHTLSLTQDDMDTLLLRTTLAGALLLAVAAGAQNPETVPSRPEPCHVVIAVDISGSMESSDAPVTEAGAGSRTLRDEGQLVFLQLLPYLQSDLCVGVAHFSDRVRYALPSAETGPLLTWGQTFLAESACRNLVRAVEFQGAYRADIAESMNWAARRIETARREYGQGPAKLIVLTNGDPRDSARELDRGRGPLLDMAKRLASQKVQVYPILINGAFVRSSDGQVRLSPNELAAEDLMHSVASMTGGRAYRLSRDLSFADILMDVFGLGMPVRSDLRVGRYDWAIVAVGEPVTSALVEPTGGAGTGAHTLTLDGALEATSGIRASVISSGGRRVTILRRPEAGEFIVRFWEGKWTLGPADGRLHAGMRIYRIPDFLMQLELKPELPWWRHEQVQVKTRLLERHRKSPGTPATVVSTSGPGLSIRMKAGTSAETDSVQVNRGRWTVPGRLYETEPFTIGTPGLYKLACELRHEIGDANVPILQSVSDVYIHAECVSIQVVDASTNQVLQEVPPAAGAAVNISLPGGRDVYFQVSGKGELAAEPQSGTLYLEGLSQTEWPLRREDGQGGLRVGPVRLIEREEQLAGRAELDVRTHVGVRHILLPRFDLVYLPAPMEVECTFDDPRATLWVGEVYRQALAISAFPVFDRFRQATLRRFPDALRQARIRTVDTGSGTTQVTAPQSRVLDLPQTGGYKGRTVIATYFVESAIAVPPADRFEIDVGAVMENLRGAAKTYAVVDPVAEGLFRWTVKQPGATPTTLFCGEPVQFHAEWRADQNISAVRFEFPSSDPNEPVFVDMPVTAGTARTDSEQVVAGLAADRDLPVYVHVTMQPAGIDRPVQVKLKAGAFRSEDRRIALEDLKAGEGGPTDIPAYAWEPVEIPLHAVFSGYTAANPRHDAAIEEFKKSCVVKVTSKTGNTQDVSDTIEWTAAVPAPAGAKGCQLTGRAIYAPDIPGRASVEVTAESPRVQGTTEASLRRAYAHVLAKAPRLSLAIHRLTPTGEEPLFDSRRWCAGEGGLSASRTRLSARMRVDVRSDGGAASGQTLPWRMMVRLLRRHGPDAPWVSEFSDAGAVAADGSFVREVQTAGNGEYALEVAGYDPQSGRRMAFFATPVIASVQSHEIRPALAPPTWLTSRVRQWPFEYQVMLHQEAAEASRPQALAFQFQLPGQAGTWMEGTTSPLSAQTPDVQPLLVRGPRFLPVAQELSNGRVQFKVSAQGIDLLRWECPDIRVISPVLERLVLSSARDRGTMPESAGTLVFDGSTELWARPQFRPAPELEGQWVASESTIYLWRHKEGASGNGPADVRALEQLLEREGAPVGARADIQALRVENVAANQAVRVMASRARLRPFGWPRRPAREQYSLVARVVYRPKDASVLPVAATGLPMDRMIAEWSDVQAIQLNTPWVVPLLWWPVLALLASAIVVALLRLPVPRPSRLALDMRLEENIAVVEPVRLDNPVLVDLQETSFVRDIQLHARHLQSRWSAGGAVRSLAVVVAFAQVVLRRALYPRRWAWTAVTPRTRGDVRAARTGLMCVWTGLGARGGRVWTGGKGSSPLPQTGQIKAVHLDLPYRVDGVSRTMRVTVRMQRTTPQSRGS